MVSSTIKWLILILSFVATTISIINSTNLEEITYLPGIDTSKAYNLKLILVDKTFKDEIANLYEFYKFSELTENRIRDFAKNISELYRRDGYFIPKIYYRKSMNQFYLIVASNGKINYKVNYYNKEISDSLMVGKIYGSIDEVEKSIKDSLLNLRNGGYLFPVVSVDSISVADSVLILNSTLQKGRKYRIKTITIEPKQYENSQLISFFGSDSTYTHGDIYRGVEKINKLENMKCSPPRFSYDSINQSISATIEVKRESLDAIDLFIGADTASVVGSLKAKFGNLFGRVNELNINVSKLSVESESVDLNYRFLLLTEKRVSVKVGVFGNKQDSTFGYLGGNVSVYHNILDNVEIELPFSYSYYFAPRVASLYKFGIGLNINELQDEVYYTIGHAYKFKWNLGVNNAELTQFSRDVEINVTGGVMYKKLNFVTSLTYSGYNYPNENLIPLTVLNQDIVRSILPYSTQLTDLYGVKLEAHKGVFNNFDIYIFNDFIYSQNSLKEYNKMSGAGVGFGFYKNRTKLTLNIGSDMLSIDNKIVLGLKLNFGI